METNTLQDSSEVEHRFEKPSAGGSIPPLATNDPYQDPFNTYRKRVVTMATSGALSLQVFLLILIFPILLYAVAYTFNMAGESTKVLGKQPKEVTFIHRLIIILITLVCSLVTLLLLKAFLVLFPIVTGVTL